MAKTVTVAYPISKVGNIAINTSKKCNISQYDSFPSREVKYIVMHYTGNYEDSAIGNANYFMGANRNASAHYFVDDDSIWQSVGVKDTAWHCGAYDINSFAYHAECRNMNSIGIEMCCTAGNYDMSAQTVELSAQLCASLCKYLNITDVDKYVVRHYDVSHKECPHPMVKNTARWNAFRARVKEILKVETPQPKVQPTVSSTVKAGSLVSIKSGAVYYTGKDIPDWIEKIEWYVSSINGSRAVLGKSKDGKYNINSPVDVKYLSVVSATQEKVESQPQTEVKETCTVELPILRKGAESGYVRTLQILLNKYNNARLDEDGIFGNGTYSAVIAYQKSRGLDADGIVGVKTWEQLLK